MEIKPGSKSYIRVGASPNIGLSGYALPWHSLNTPDEAGDPPSYTDTPRSRERSTLCSLYKRLPTVCTNSITGRVLNVASSFKIRSYLGQESAPSIASLGSHQF